MTTKKLTINITKDFSDTKLKNVIIACEKNPAENFKTSVREIILAKLKETSSTIFINLQSSKLNLLNAILENLDAKILKYVLTNKFDESLFENLKTEFIIRESNKIGNLNYIIFDKKNIVIFDNNLYGYNFDDENLSKEMYKIFINNFWNKSQREFIDKIENVSKEDCPFDLVPIINSDCDKIIFDTLKTPLDENLKNAEKIYIPNFYPTDQQLENLKSIYVKNINQFNEQTAKMLCDKNIDVKYCDSKSFINTICVAGKTFLLNFNPLAKNNNLLEEFNAERFAIQIEENIEDFVSHILFYETTYGDCVGKEMFKVKQTDTKKFEILEKKSIKKYYSCDLKEFKDIEKNYKFNPNLIEEKIELTQNNVDNQASDIILDSNNKQAAVVDFEIEITLKQNSIKTKAKIYDEYESFKSYVENQRKEFIKKIEKILSDKKINLNKNFEILNSKQKNLEKIISKLNQKDENFAEKNEKLKSEIQKIKNQKIALQNNFDSLIKKVEFKKAELNSQLSNLSPTTIIEVESINQKLNTIAKTLEINISSPKQILIGIPKFGTLYESNGKFEYLLFSEENLANAKKEFEENYKNAKSVDYLIE